MNPLILMAEDDPDIQLVTRLSLKRAGYRVEAFSNGRELLDRVQPDRIQGDRPDVILLDWMMPEMDGPETCTRLKANPLTADIPVVFITAKSQAAEVQAGIVAGAAGYLTKPFNALTIGDDLKRILTGA